MSTSASKTTQMFTCTSSCITKPPFRQPLFFLKPFCSSSSLDKLTRNPLQKFAPFSQLCYSSWINQWPKPPPKPAHFVVSSFKERAVENYAPETSKGAAGDSAIDRIVLRLRNLGLGDDEDNEGEDEGEGGVEGEGGRFKKGYDGGEKLGDLLKRDWVRPDMMLVEEEEEGGGDGDGVLPWEREEVEERRKEEEVVDGGRMRKRVVKAPSLAELTIEDEELRRLRREGIVLRERVNVPKAGVTNAVLEKVHEKWLKNELVRLKFHEVLARDMKTAHEIVERRTGGLVIWRSGSVMVVYRGSNYEGPSSRSHLVNPENNSVFVPDVSATDNSTIQSSNDASLSQPKPVLSPRVRSMTEDEAELDGLLNSLGPRFEEWWGTGILPVNADLLPQTIPGYKTPLRLLPTGMRLRLTNAEMTNMRKHAKSLPCHFALGRNRHHQGLAAAIIKLWEKSLVVKIAVKRGIQNTNNKIMADEIKMLTGGVLLLRNKYYIVMYRGKDFLPSAVATALTERQEMTKQIQDVEEKVRSKPVETVTVSENDPALVGTLAEFYEAQARWGREISPEEQAKMIEEASRAKTERIIKRFEHKLAISQTKKLKAEKLLSKIVASWDPVGPSDDLETITEEERVMFRRVGLRMKAYLPLGIRGVFDGVIENMHLHWKYRELVKLISKEKEQAFAEETARLLEYESGGILVTIERVPKGFALIFYRGKNYRRPITIRPRNLLTKAKALKRRVALQRYEALSQHISELERTIEQTKKQIGVSSDASTTLKPETSSDWNDVSDFSQSEDEASWMDSSDEDEDEDLDEEDDEDSPDGGFPPT
ncbi:hypothetical protein LIER_14228 [Lithospermum erythrorhizon]|uniref:CRM domain-containing protein n=1 Tax=Lithospermum erythrorhizon TaxID=34254 RepID=A0AAV3PZX7_LITER